MTDYEYTDRDGDTTRIYPHLGDVYIQNHETETGPASVAVAVEDAPAVALAILEAAGCDKAGKARLSRAMIALIEHISAEKVRAERESEDAKVKEFFNALNPGFIADDVDITDHVRRQYRAAREFFTPTAEKAHNHIFGDDSDGTCPNCDEKPGWEVMPAPRVLNYGDPEPDHDTKWRDTGGNVWSYGDTCHRDYPVWRFESAAGSSFGRWSHLDACFFPMTEES